MLAMAMAITDTDSRELQTGVLKARAKSYRQTHKSLSPFIFGTVFAATNTTT